MVHGALSPLCIALGAGGARILKATTSPEDRAAYRAPEQIRGEEPDVLSDVFAYGALVYEIATGNRAFTGAGAELAQKILREAPAPLPADSAVSLAMEDVIAGCLEKDRSQRRQRVQNAVIELKLAGRSLTRSGEAPGRLPERGAPAPAAAASGTAPAALRPAPRITVARPSVAPYAAQGRETIYGLSFTRRTWAIGGAILVVATLAAVVLFLGRKPAPAVLKFAVTKPENTSYPGMPSVSPDGRYLRFSAVGPEGKRMLWLRPLDALHATVTWVRKARRLHSGRRTASRLRSLAVSI